MRALHQPRLRRRQRGLRPPPSGGGLRRAVAITGVGVVGAFGLGVEPLAARLAAGEVAASAVDLAGGHHRPGSARTALLAADVDLGGLLTPAQARRMSPPARFAVAAMRLALADAGLSGLGRDEHLGTGIVVGTAFGPSSVTEQLLAQIFGAGPEVASPALFTESVASSSAAQMALAIGARGPSVALTQREASDLAALAEGVRLIATGAAERVLVTVVDEMIPLLHAMLDRFRALARPGPDGREVARPFDRRRGGLLAAEGATVLALEPAEAAAARGARVRARVAAVARGFDPTAPAWDWGTGGAALAKTLARGLARTGVAVDSIELVASGAAGTRRGDALEAAVLDGLFGARRPPIAAFKARTGEYGGAALAAAVLASEGSPVAATAGFELADPALGSPPVTPVTTPLSAAPRRTLVSSLATAGGAAWAVLDPGEPSPRRVV